MSSSVSSSSISTSSATVSQSSSASMSSLASPSSVSSSSNTASATTTVSAHASSSGVSSRTSTSSPTSSGTSTSTFRFPDLQSSSPSPRPIVNIALTLIGVDISLFGASQRSSTLETLINALSSASGIASSFISIRRVRDMTNPKAPAIVYLHPQFAGDSFSGRRLQSQRILIGGSSSVSIDSQIILTSNEAAATLSSSLQAAPGKLSSGVSTSLWSQGSALAGSQIAVVVEPYAPSTQVTKDSSSSSSSIGGISGGEGEED